MRYTPSFTGSSPQLSCAPFPASVPGNIQLDYITAHPEFVRDIHYGLEHRRMQELEGCTWFYRTALPAPPENGEKLWFVTKGIDYEWSLLLDGEEFYAHEGMFSPVELCLTDLLGAKLRAGAEFAVRILPPPKIEGVPDTRARAHAARSVKPPVSYGWDWHPRVIPSGIWDDTFFETRGPGHIANAEVRYTLAEDFTEAHVTLRADCAESAAFVFRDPDGREVFAGTVTPDAPELSFPVRNPVLWWCRNLGRPALYTWEVKSSEHAVSGTVGFRRVRLVMNEGAWLEPDGFPKSRSTPPAQIELNGVRVFAKGSNYVSQELFPGTLTEARYEEAIRAAAECNMNIFRCWGGSGIQKDCFYDLCDRLGIMLWVEFPLACNDYADDPHYLSVLRQEGEAIIRRLRRHPSLTIWCGGNELFNSWSGITDQRLALRMLGSLTLELSPGIPFLPTSPLYGMKHGGYTFLDRKTGLDPFRLFGSTQATAYTEFGMPGLAPEETLRAIIPPEELFPPRPGEGSSWEAHHAFNAWGEDAWLCPDTLSRFGDTSTLRGMLETSARLQRIGYKAVFETARRQKPRCAMAINWCWNEPWKCAVNNSLLAYPNIPKPAYFAVRDSLRDVLGAAEIEKYAWAPGETFSAVPWLFNDTAKEQKGTVTLKITAGGKNAVICEARLAAPPLANAHGEAAFFRLPDFLPPGGHFVLTAVLETEDGSRFENEYELFIGKEQKK